MALPLLDPSIIVAICHYKGEKALMCTRPITDHWISVACVVCSTRMRVVRMYVGRVPSTICMYSLLVVRHFKTIPPKHKQENRTFVPEYSWAGEMADISIPTFLLR